MTNMYTGTGSDDMPTAPYHVSETGSGGSGGRRPRRKWIVALLVTCVAAGGGAFAVAQAATSQPSQAGTGISQAANSSTANSQAGQTAATTRQVTVLRQVLGAYRLARLRLLGGMYGQYTFETKQGPRTLAFERGTITSIKASDVTVRATDGTTWTWMLTGTSVVREDGTRLPTSTLVQGQLVFTGGQVTDGARDARLIVIREQPTTKSSA